MTWELINDTDTLQTYFTRYAGYILYRDVFRERLTLRVKGERYSAVIDRPGNFKTEAKSPTLRGLYEALGIASTQNQLFT